MIEVGICGYTYLDLRPSANHTPNPPTPLLLKKTTCMICPFAILCKVSLMKGPFQKQQRYSPLTGYTPRWIPQSSPKWMPCTRHQIIPPFHPIPLTLPPTGTKTRTQKTTKERLELIKHIIQSFPWHPPQVRPDYAPPIFLIV